MSTLVLRAITESGAVWDDPSEDPLFELLSDIDRGDETWFIVERVSDATGQTYIQVIQDAQTQVDGRATSGRAGATLWCDTRRHPARL